ncbi:flagellar export chaperone FliS [Vulcaniibacterium tengchongense]|uniref:Flagellar secretion chaperone FliS n=1 Tax=Vulcaniibacterium tengchongense TaxID=1273429 RepID=A0A3N4VCY1_9GAMM|nr:flagellar export chaperone FliS [Vulcaniibacterium tengchongense]RPE80872.1 flagellar protein FliS [Vulcaniibacterium tengchongense]
MYGSPRNYAQHYRSTGLSSAVLEADPHRLIALMLAGARDRLRLAEACLARGDVPRKAKAISDASAIVGGLSGALDLDAGGEIASGLQALYDYVQQRLVAANADNDAGALREADGLLGEIESAWRAIAPQPAQAARP